MADNLDLNSYVALRDIDEGVYNLTEPGQHGWVRDRLVDEFGFAKVFIEWDKSDGLYKGEPDGWTYESHFALVTEDQNTVQGEEPCPECGGFHRDASGMIEKFLDELHAGIDAALGADGFILITVREDRDDEQRLSIFAPQIFQAFLTPESSEMIEAQLLHIASMSFQEGAIQKLNLLREHHEEDDQE